MPSKLPESVPAPARLILDFIGGVEAPAGYGTIFANRQGRLKKPLTEMTIGEVIDAQPGWSKHNGSSAAGRYQFMRATLVRLCNVYTEITGRWLFDALLQDRLGYVLLIERGYEAFMAGKLSATAFGNRLAMEWASFPVLTSIAGAHRNVKRGETYYSGDKLNKALVDPAAVEELLKMAKALADTPVFETPQHNPESASTNGGGGNAAAPAEAAHSKPVVKSGRFWTWFATGTISSGTIIEKLGAYQLDWRVQIGLLVVVVGFAIYAIASMPGVRNALGIESNGGA